MILIIVLSSWILLTVFIVIFTLWYTLRSWKKDRKAAQKRADKIARWEFWDNL